MLASRETSAETTQGRPAACASTRTKGKPSNSDGIIRQSNAEYHWSTSSRAPRRWTRSVKCAFSMASATCVLSSPSPMKTTSAFDSNRQICRATSNENRGFFSGASLPTHPTRVPSHPTIARQHVLDISEKPYFFKETPFLITLNSRLPNIQSPAAFEHAKRCVAKRCSSPRLMNSVN